MFDTLTKPSTQLKALKLVPKGSFKKNTWSFLTYGFLWKKSPYLILLQRPKAIFRDALKSTDPTPPKHEGS